MNNGVPESSAFLGPNAAWLEGEGDDYVFSHVLAEGKRVLSRHLRERAAFLESGEAGPDLLIQEIKRQVAEAGVNGDLVRAKDLADLALDLLYAKENCRRLM